MRFHLLIAFNERRNALLSQEFKRPDERLTRLLIRPPKQSDLTFEPAFDALEAAPPYLKYFDGRYDSRLRLIEDQAYLALLFTACGIDIKKTKLLQAKSLLKYFTHVLWLWIRKTSTPHCSNHTRSTFWRTCMVCLMLPFNFRRHVADPGCCTGLDVYWDGQVENNDNTGLESTTSYPYRVLRANKSETKWGSLKVYPFPFCGKCDCIPFDTSNLSSYIHVVAIFRYDDCDDHVIFSINEVVNGIRRLQKDGLEQIKQLCRLNLSEKKQGTILLPIMQRDCVLTM